MEDMFKDSAPKGTALGLVTGGLNALYATATQQQQIQAQKDWWYEQQKYLEEHNSPAYQSMKLRKAGLNPYQGVGSQPLGNVSSDLPGRPMELFNTGAISGLMQTLSQLDVNEAHANQLDAQAGLFGAQTNTEGQRYRNLVQEWFYNEIMYEIGLIDAEERGIKRDELKSAYQSGNYTPTSDTARAADDAHNVSTSQSEYYNSLSSFYDKSVEKLSEEITSLKRANKIGDEYDPIIAQYEAAIKSYEANIKEYESKMADIAEHALKEFGWDLKTIPPVYHPYIIPIVNSDMNGTLSNNDFNSAIETMSNWSGHQINNYNKSTNPDYIDAPTQRDFNIRVRENNIDAADVDGKNLMRIWNMQMDEARFSLDVINTIRDLMRIMPRDKNSTKTTTVIHKRE